MGYKYVVRAAKYPYQGYWEKVEQFKTFRKAVRFIKRCQKEGFEIIDLNCRDFKNQ